MSKSPKRKNKSVDIMKFKNQNIATRSKFGGTFESIKKTTGDLFNQMSSYKKDK